MRLVAACVCAALMMPALVFAQAGSTGGVIGKTDKSISGSEERIEPQRLPAHKESSRKSTRRGSDGREALPSIIRITERAAGTNFTITLKKTGGNTYLGTWNHGYVSTFTVIDFTAGSLKMLREDKPALGAVSGRYTGQRSGNSAHGEAVESHGFTPTWDASW